MKKFIKPVVIILIGGFIFFLGYLEGVGTKTSVITEKVNVPVTKTVRVNVPVTQTKVVTKTIPADTTEWKALKDIDDSGFTTESKVFAVMPQVATTCSDAIQATANGDTAEQYNDAVTMKSLTTQINGLNTTLNSEVNQRASILKQLGY